MKGLKQMKTVLDARATDQMSEKKKNKVIGVISAQCRLSQQKQAI